MRFKTCNLLLGAAVLWGAFSTPGAAQNYSPANPVPADQGFLPGATYSPGQIESVNPVSGTVGLSIPLAKLPAWPTGYTPAVGLTYNSAFYTLTVDTDAGGHLRELYSTSPTSGGWKYTFKYELWSASEPASATAGKSTYLTTADGSNHLLMLVSTFDANGNPGTAFFHQNYPNQPVYDIDFTGQCVNSNESACNSGHFSGRLVFATADGSFIRVESNTVTKTWVAYFPDGAQVTGDFPPEGAANYGEMAAGEWNRIQDRNGNVLALVNFCVESGTCTTKIVDLQGREIDIAYGSYNNFPYLWTDTISQPGPNGRVSTAVNWTYYSFTSPAYDASYIGPNNFGTWTLNGGLYVVSSVQLPPGKAGDPSTVYVFKHDPPSPALAWGELHSWSQNTLTSGADVTPWLQGNASLCPQQYKIDYSYRFDSSTNHRVMGTLINPVSTKVLSYQEVREGANAVQMTETTTYSIPVPTSFDPTRPAPTGGVATIGYPDGSQSQVYSAPQCVNSNSGACPALVYKVVNPDLSQTELGWASASTTPGAPSGSYTNPYVRYTAQTIGTKAKGTSVAKDANGNTTSVGEYDWFSASALTQYRSGSGMLLGLPGTAARTTIADYYLPPNPTQYWISRGPAYLRAAHTITVGSSVITNNYDNPLTTANLKSQQRWDSATSSYITNSWTYTARGDVLTATDPNNVVTNISYDACRFPSEVDSAYNLPEQRTLKPVYDCGSGLLLSSTDADNGLTTTYTYDNIGRQKKVEESGGGLYRSTTTSYDDVGLSVTPTQDQTSLAATTYRDAVGRPRLTVSTAGDKVQKAYRFGTGMSYELASNPYIATSDSTMGWTLTTRNPSSAQTTVVTYAGATPPAPWGNNENRTGTVTISNNLTVAGCAGPGTVVTDQAGNSRTICPDGLGRLKSVTEADGTAAQYNYDLLDNVIQVTMGGKTRGFEYSTAGRLRKACNPESATADCSALPLPGSGLEQYTYDAGGNLKTKTDARGRITTFTSYDGLNRLSGESYSDGTAAVGYIYDQDFKGLLSSTTRTVSGATYGTAYTHDGFGRVKTSTQTAASDPPYVFQYQYSLANELTQVQYPSGRIIKYVPDGKGRVGQVQDGLSQANYVNASYTAPGGINTLTLGNGLTETLSWNDRVQLTGLTVAPQSGPAALALGLYPCTGLATSCANGNTGRVQTQTMSLPGFSATQNYTYDAVNRLNTAGEGTGSWSQAYNYDASGNMYVTPGSSFIGSFTPTASTNFDVQNRLQVQNLSYDSSGNQTVAGPTNTFDAEGRMTASAIGATTTSYVYDGEGQRVAKLTTVNGALTGRVVYVHDASGNLAAEYDFDGSGNPVTAQSPCGTPTCYVSVDQLGSTRLVTDNAGNVAKRYDFSPFGTEIFAGTGGRTTGMKYQTGADGFNPKFTGQFRGAADTEGGLDYFQMRYYSPEQGRFVGVDPENAGADAASPQTWNGYSYVSNDPLNNTDPTGEGIFGTIFGIVAGIFTANPWIGLAAAGAGNGIDAAIWGPQAVGVPGLSLGSLTGCGGPLGSCGTLGTGPWSENPGLDRVQDPGRFIFDVIKVQASGQTRPLDSSSVQFSDIVFYAIARAYLMQAPGMRSMFRRLESSPRVYTVRLNRGGKNDYDEKTDTIRWDPHQVLVCTGGGTQSPALGLGHELAHALGPRLPWYYAPDNYDDIEEKRVITGPEKAAASWLGECVRTDHRGSQFYVPNPIMH